MAELGWRCWPRSPSQLFLFPLVPLAAPTTRPPGTPWPPGQSSPLSRCRVILGPRPSPAWLNGAPSSVAHQVQLRFTCATGLTSFIRDWPQDWTSEHRPFLDRLSGSTAFHLRWLADQWQKAWIASSYRATRTSVFFTRRKHPSPCPCFLCSVCPWPGPVHAWLLFNGEWGRASVRSNHCSTASTATPVRWEVYPGSTIGGGRTAAPWIDRHGWRRLGRGGRCEHEGLALCLAGPLPCCSGEPFEHEGRGGLFEHDGRDRCFFCLDSGTRRLNTRAITGASSPLDSWTRRLNIMAGTGWGSYSPARPRRLNMSGFLLARGLNSAYAGSLSHGWSGTSLWGTTDRATWMTLTASFCYHRPECIPTSPLPPGPVYARHLA